MYRHEGDEVFLVCFFVLIGEQGDVLEVGREAGVYIGGLLAFFQGRRADGLRVFHEGFDAVEEGVDVVQAPDALDGGVFFEFVHEAGAASYVNGEVVGIVGGRAAVKFLHHGHKIRDSAAGAGSHFHFGDAVPHAAVGLSGQFADFVHAGLADAAAGEIDDAAEGFFVAGIDGEAEVGDEVFDFLALVERLPAENAVGHVVAAEVFFKNARLCVGAVQHGNLVVAEVVAVFLLYDGVHHAVAFFGVGARFDDLDPLTLAFVRPDFFLNLTAVVHDDLVGRLHDVLGGAVVLFELEHLDTEGFEVLLEVEDVLNGGAPEGVDALRVVAYHAYIAGAVVVVDELAHNGVLEVVGVLKLIYEEVPEALAVFFEDVVGIALEEFVEAVEQVVEVHGAGAFAAGGVLFINRVGERAIGAAVFLAEVFVVLIEFGGDEAAFGRRNARAERIDVVRLAV